MTPEQAARQLAIVRIVMGGGFALMPGLAGRAWIGGDADSAGSKLLARAFGARDAAIGIGMLLALRDRGSAKPWALAGLISDLADFAATHSAGEEIPAGARTAVLAIASSAAGLGAWFLAT